MSGAIRLFRRDTRGAAAVEMALMLPILMALTFGGFEGGNYLLTEHKAIKGVRDGARYAARLPLDYYDGCGPDMNDPASGVGLPDAATAAANIMNVTRTGAVTGDINGDGVDDPRIRGWTSSSSQIAIIVSCPSTAASATGIYKDLPGGAPVVTVATRVPYRPIVGMLGFDVRGAVVQAQAQAAVTGI